MRRKAGQGGRFGPAGKPPSDARDGGGRRYRHGCGGGTDPRPRESERPLPCPAAAPTSSAALRVGTSFASLLSDRSRPRSRAVAAVSPQRKCKTVKRPSRKKQPTCEGELLKAYEFKGQTQHRDIARFGQDKSYVPLSFPLSFDFIYRVLRYTLQSFHIPLPSKGSGPEIRLGIQSRNGLPVHSLLHKSPG